MTRHGQNICWLRFVSIEDKRVVVRLPFVDAKIQTIKRCTKWQMKIAFQCFLHYVSICQTESEALKHFMLGLKNMAQVREIFPRQNSNGPNQFFKSLSSLLPALHFPPLVLDFNPPIFNWFFCYFYHCFNLWKSGKNRP